MPTIRDACRGRFVPLPGPLDATFERRVEIMRGNLRAMREVLGCIPSYFPQQDAEIPDWITAGDRRSDQIRRILAALNTMPADTKLPTPFIAANFAAR